MKNTSKIAIFILAHKNSEQINYLIQFFPKNDVNIYIHIDAKNNNLISKIKKDKNVFVYSYYKINWGGVNVLKSILFLAEKALLNKDNSYFHLVSGEDYPCPESYLSFTQKYNRRNNYLNYFSIPYKGWKGMGGIDRVNFIHIYDILDFRQKDDAKLIRQFNHCQAKNSLILPRANFYNQFKLDLYGGSAWWSLTREALEYVITFTENNLEFINRFNYTFAADELYFQTVLLNSEYSNQIINDNLRYIDWNQRPQNSIPCYLDKSDFNKIYYSNSLFARKFTFETIKEYTRYLK